MTNYNERLDEVLDDVLIGMYCTNPDGDFVPLYDSKNVLRDEAKQALTSLIKELVAEAKPEVPEEYERDDALYIGFERGREYYYDAISNLLKELEEL